MPYARNSDLPAQVRDALPEAAQTRFRTVVNAALERGLGDSKAFGSGWTAVGNGWTKPKDGGKWVRKAAKPRTLFASRPVENGQDLVDWAKAQGFPTALKPDDMHVTQAYSKEPLIWPEAHDDAITVRSTDGRKVGLLGDQGAMVLHFDSPTLQARHEQLKTLGAKSDFPNFNPHVTISWQADGVDPAKVKPYDGPLVLGPERFKEVDPNWEPGKLTEKREPNRIITVTAIDGEDQLDALLRGIKAASDPGHSFSIVVDPGDPNEKRYSFDGDGADRILSIDTVAKLKEELEKYNENHDAQGRFSSGDGGGGSAEAGSGGGGGKPPTAPEPDGPMVFHGTSQAAVDGIVQDGIIPDKSKGATELHDKTFGTMIKVGDGSANAYFSASPYQALRFARMAAEATGSTPVVVPVHLSQEQAKGLTWDNAGNQDTKLAGSIPASQVGKPAVGLDAIKQLSRTFEDKWKQFSLTSQQRSGGIEERPIYAFKPQEASAVRDIMGKAAGDALSGDHQVVFMVFLVNDKATDMEKAGARHNASDRKMVQEMHDHSVKLGAECPGMTKHDDDKTTKHDDEGKKFVKINALAKAEVVKVDDEIGIVFGWAMVSKDYGDDYWDVQEDNIPEDAMLKASADYMASDRIAKEMHFGEGKGTILFAFPLTTDIAKAMGIECRHTGLMIGMKPDTEELLNKFRTGEYTGFSIGGERLIDELVELEQAA